MKIINVIVRPNSSKNEVAFNKEKSAYIVLVKAPPDKGKANLELIKTLGKYFKKRVEIMKGFTSKNKIVKILE